MRVIRHVVNESMRGQVSAKSRTARVTRGDSVVTFQSLEADTHCLHDAKGPFVLSGIALPTRLARIAPALLLMLFATAASAAETQAPPFAVKTVDGRTVRLADMKNRPVILDFWATWCAPCRASMPHLNDVSARYAKQGLAVVGMSVDESGPAPVKRFATQLGVRFTVAMANDDVLDAYGPIRVIPTTFFINRKGEIVRRVVGYIDNETMEGYVQEILP